MGFNIYNYSLIDLNTFSLEDVKSAKINSIIQDVKEPPKTIVIGNEEYTICKLCGKKLKVTDSCKLGMGPVCFKKYKEKLNRNISLF